MMINSATATASATMLGAMVAGLLSSCATVQPTPRLDYLNSHRAAVEGYMDQNSEELSALSLEIIDECYFKVLEDRSNLSYEDVQRLPIRGLVTYELDNSGKIVSSAYHISPMLPPDKRKENCIARVANGQTLSPSPDVRYVYQQFTVEENGD